MRAWPVARSIFDAPLCERSERADNKLDKMKACFDVETPLLKNYYYLSSDKPARLARLCLALCRARSARRGREAAAPQISMIIEWAATPGKARLYFARTARALTGPVRIFSSRAHMRRMSCWLDKASPIQVLTRRTLREGPWSGQNKACVMSRACLTRAPRGARGAAVAVVLNQAPIIFQNLPIKSKSVKEGNFRLS